MLFQDKKIKIHRIKRISLTEQQKAGFESQHKELIDRRKCDRIKAILLRNESWSTPMIAQALRIHETTVVRYIEQYLRDGKLSCDSGGSKSFLTDKHMI